ncbi:hypothetical protein WEI85_47550 [Actinomycetes bacterium KLBMP 9797]
MAVGTAVTPATRMTATLREDAVALLFGACLVGGALSDGWAHANIVETIEGFFTPWHGLLYAGFAASAAWTFWLAYQRRDRAPIWWRDGWPAGYRLGALGVLLFLAAGLADMVWHETIGVEVGLEAGFSPSHMVLDAAGVLIVTSPLRSWWTGRAGGWRTAIGVASLGLAAMAATILLTHSDAFVSAAPTVTYVDDGGELTGLDGPARLLALHGVASYVITTLLLLVPFLLAYRRGPVPGGATAVTGGVALFTMVMFEFPAPQAAGALLAVGGAAVADLALLRLDTVRGLDARLRLPLAGALIPLLVWSSHLLGLHLAEGLRWPPEMWTGVVTMTAILGALLGTLTTPVVPVDRGSFVAIKAR